MEIENQLAKAVMIVEGVIEQVSDQFREVAYPVLLDAAIQRNQIAGAIESSSEVESGTSEPSHLQGVLSRPCNELLARAKPKGHTETVLLVSAHIDASEETLSVNAIRQVLGETKRSLPTNIPEVLTRLVQQGLLSVVEKQGRNTIYAMTDLGREKVQSRLEVENEE